jgi:hypothetical protein
MICINYLLFPNKIFHLNLFIYYRTFQSSLIYFLFNRLVALLPYLEMSSGTTCIKHDSRVDSNTKEPLDLLKMNPFPKRLFLKRLSPPELIRWAVSVFQND